MPMVVLLIGLGWLVVINNLIIQYGYTASGDVILPIAYTSHYSVCIMGNHGTIDYTNKYDSKTLVGFTAEGIQVATYTAKVIPADWITIGY